MGSSNGVSRGVFRPHFAGRSPSFLVAALLVGFGILGFSYYSLYTQYSGLEMQLKTLVENEQTNRKLFNKKSKEYQLIQTNNDELKARIQLKEEDIKAKDIDLDKLKANIIKIKSNCQSQLKTLNNDIETLSAKNKQLEKSLEELDQLKKTLQLKEDEIDKLKKEKAAQQSQNDKSRLNKIVRDVINNPEKKNEETIKQDKNTNSSVEKPLMQIKKPTVNNNNTNIDANNQANSFNPINNSL